MFSHRPLARTALTLLIACAAPIIGSAANLPEKTHKAKPALVLPGKPGIARAATVHEPLSPYARAAARRQASGLVPAGHAHVRTPARPVPLHPAAS